MAIPEHYFYWVYDPTLARMALNAVYSMIGFIYGMSLVYIVRLRRNRVKMWIIPVLVSFYVAIFGLGEVELIRRMIIFLVLLHVSIVGIGIMFENQVLKDYVRRRH